MPVGRNVRCRAGRRAQAPRCRASRANGSSHRGCDLACWRSCPGPFLSFLWVESGCGGSVVGEDLGDRPQPEGHVKQADHAEGEPCAHRHWVLLPNPCHLKRGPRTQANSYSDGEETLKFHAGLRWMTLPPLPLRRLPLEPLFVVDGCCLLYTSDAADE